MSSLIDDNGNKTTWTYDCGGRKESETKGIQVSPALADRDDADTEIQWTYYPDGLVETMTKEDETILTYEYDDARRLEEITVSNLASGVVGTTLQTFNYDGLSRRLQTTDNNGSGTGDDVACAWAYDSLGRVIEESQQIGAGAVRRASSNYASLSRSRLTYPNGRQIDYEYFPGGKLKKVKDGATDLATYDYIGGRTLRRAAANGLNLDLRNGSATRYDGAGRPARWSYTDGSTEYGWTYTYDRAGNPLSATPLLDAKDSQTYSYDSASRLIAYERHDGSNQTWPDMDLGREWSMDGLGNRRQTETTDSGGNPTIWQWLNTSFNEYYSVAGASLDHDANGNLISEPGVSTRTFRWDALNRLKDDGGVYVTAYLYDADNRRVKKDLAAAGADVEYAYDGWLTLEEFDEGQSALKRQYVHGRQMDELVVIDLNQNGDATASGAGDARYFYHQNLIQSVGALSGAAGAIVEAYEYDPYGRHVLIRDGDSDGRVDFDATDARTVLGVSAAGSPFTFTGRDYDPEIDKHHYRNRAYSWQAERFISRDPSGFADGAHLYRYVANQPAKSFDPTGKWAEDIHRDATTRWAQDSGYSRIAAAAVGKADEAVDGIRGTPIGPRGPLPGPVGDQSYHFDRPAGGLDSRLGHFERHYRKAVQECVENDNGRAAAKQLGTALHPLQDWVAHGDYGRFDEEDIFAMHNMYSPQADWDTARKFPDNPRLDADNSSDGRPAGSAMHYISPHIFAITGAVREYAWYIPGTKRLNLTKRLTEENLARYLQKAKTAGGPCCKAFFGGRP